jgi:hypothetical protein
MHHLEPLSMFDLEVFQRMEQKLVLAIFLSGIVLHFELLEKC